MKFPKINCLRYNSLAIILIYVIISTITTTPMYASPQETLPEVDADVLTEEESTDTISASDPETEVKPVVKISFSENLSKAKELYGDGIVIHKIPITVSSDSFIDDYVLINVSVKSKTDTLLVEEFEIITKTIVIPKKAEGELLVNEQYYIEVKINSDIIKEESEFLELQLSTTASDQFETLVDYKYHTLEIVDGVNPFDSDNPFRVYIGSNFNFFDGATVENLFGSVEAFLPNSFGHEERFGLIGGITQSQALSYDSASVDGINRQYFENTPTGNVDSANVISQSLSLKSEVSVQNTEMHINLFYNYYKGEKLKLHAGIQGMTVWRKYIYDYTYTNQQSDTLFTPISEVSDNVRSTPFPTPDRRTRSFTDTYVGACFPITYSSKYGELFIQQGVGCLWIAEGERRPYLNWKFRLTEKKLGITFGGEIFSVINGNDASPGTRRLNTLYNIYIAKAWDLSKLVGYGE